MSLLVAGPEVHAKKLLQYIKNYDSLCAGDLTCLQSNIELLELSREKWLIDNKYYSAEVSFLVHLTDKDSATGLSHTAEDFDGVIYIVPSREKFLASQLANQLGGDDDKLRLLVYLNKQGEGEEENEGNSDREFYSLFCIDHGFELVEIDESTLTLDYDARDKFGLPRLLEALQAHMWPTMRRKDKQSADAAARLEA
eukprot:gene36574-44367_t